MITNSDKINIIDKRIEDLNTKENSMYEYIEKINNGMEDPDLTIEQCESIGLNFYQKKQALISLRETLTNQG